MTRRGRIPIPLLLVICLPALLPAARAAGESRLPAPEAARPLPEMLREGLRLNAEGRYDAALALWRRLEALHPEHPAPNVYAAETLYWLMIYDDGDTRYDPAVLEQAEAGIRKGRAMVLTRPDDAQARFLFGQALMHLGRLRGIRRDIYSAGKLGEQARPQLELALQMDPALLDAKYPLGMYYYYASLVPSLFRWLSFLWFIPTGDGDTGLAYLDEVREAGALHDFSAAFYLANILSYHDLRLDRAKALALMRGLHARYPSNSLFHFELIELLAMADRQAEVIAEARQLEAHPGGSRQHRGRGHMARVWRARAELLTGHPRRARQTLAVFGEEGVETPNWGSPWIWATRGQIFDVLGERAAAVAEYERVDALDLPLDEYRAARMARAGLAEPFRLVDVAGPRAAPE